MLKTLKKQNGFTGTDIIVSLAIIMLFTGLIVTISYNIYLATSLVKRTSAANSYITDVFEYIDKKYYDEITQDNLLNYFNEKYYYKDATHTQIRENAMAKANNVSGEDMPYKVEIKVTRYGQAEGKLDLVKTIEITVKYNLANKEKTITMERIKKREIFIAPNTPQIDDLKVSEPSKEIVGVRYKNGTYEVYDIKNSNWYNYTNGEWALVLVLDNGKNAYIGQKILSTQIDSFGKIYFWVPRYAYNSTDNTKVTFIYGNQDKYVASVLKDGNNYQELKTIAADYIIPSNFNGASADDNKKGVWLLDNSSSGPGTIYGILNSSEYNRKNI